MYTNQKVSIILAILRQQVDRDYGFPPEPVPYDLDVFFLNGDNDTWSVPVLENTVWPAKEEHSQLLAFGELFMTRTMTQVTEPNSLYMEYARGYRLSHIVKQFALALMHYDQERIHVVKQFSLALMHYDQERIDAESFVGYPPEEIEAVIHRFAYFLITLTGESGEDTLRHIARFIMQLSLFKQCKPVKGVANDLLVSRYPLVGRDVLHYLHHPDTLPTTELHYTIEYQGNSVNANQLVTLLPASDMNDYQVTHVQEVHWGEPLSSGITLSELATVVYPTLYKIKDFSAFSSAYSLLMYLMLDGLNTSTTYPVMTLPMMAGQLHYISAAKKVNHES